MRTGLRVTYAGSGGSKRDLDPITPRCFGAIRSAISKAKQTVDHSFLPARGINHRCCPTARRRITKWDISCLRLRHGSRAIREPLSGTSYMPVSGDDVRIRAGVEPPNRNMWFAMCCPSNICICSFAVQSFLRRLHKVFPGEPL